jgi:diguanylate cyclase (GGDEF)-like protein/PAS domain S-box-containing protein
MTQETILIVDDNRQIADFLAGTALPGMGFRTLVAYDGRSGMKTVREQKESLDMLLLDLQLTDMSGLDFLRRMNEQGYNIPTILCTAHGSEQVAADAFRLGVQDYLTKPIDLEKLKEAINRALTETRLRRETANLTAQLQEQVAWLTALGQVGRSVTSTLDLDEVLRRIVDAGVFLTKAEEGFLALLDEQNGQLYLRAAKNIDANKVTTMRLPVSDTNVGEVLRTRHPLRLTKSPNALPIKVSTGYLVHSLIIVPILSRGAVMGVLQVNNRTVKRAFVEKDEAVMISLADYAGVALENAQLYQQAQQEISERKRIESALRDSEERFALAVSGAKDGLWDWDMRSNQIYYSPRWKEMLGYTEQELGNNPNEWLQRVHPEDIGSLKSNLSAHLKGKTSHFECEHRLQHKDGNYRWILSRGIAVWDAQGNVTRMAGSQTDITLRKQAEARLLRDALFDSLTGLPNRTLFIDRLKHSIEYSRRTQNYLYAVLFMDIDRFKDVNDSLGHAMGDTLLINMARLLESILRPNDTVARLGGDEFVILLDGINNISDATIVADRLQEKLHATSILDDHSIYVSASIGIVLSLSGYDRPEDLLRDADIAMYRAKANGRDRYEIYDAVMRQRILDRLALEGEMRKAIEAEELLVHYQPIIDVVNGRVIGFEALTRWKHPRLGILYPGQFLPLAEETGLIIAIDRWVLRRACEQTVAWQKRFPSSPPLSINVNISSRQIVQPDFIDYLKGILRETRLDVSCLDLEITENTIMENFDQTAIILQQLRQLGVQIHIDDFGVGYSSLSYLSRFPISALKIDRSFIHMMTTDVSYMKIVQAIIRLTHNLGLSVTAEGVETQEQLTQLRELECEYIQGYLISKPIDSQQATKLLSSPSHW